MDFDNWPAVCTLLVQREERSESVEQHAVLSAPQVCPLLCLHQPGLPGHQWHGGHQWGRAEAAGPSAGARGEVQQTGGQTHQPEGGPLPGAGVEAAGLAPADLPTQGPQALLGLRPDGSQPLPAPALSPPAGRLTALEDRTAAGYGLSNLNNKSINPFQTKDREEEEGLVVRHRLHCCFSLLSLILLLMVLLVLILFLKLFNYIWES